MTFTGSDVCPGPPSNARTRGAQEVTNGSWWGPITHANDKSVLGQESPRWKRRFMAKPDFSESRELRNREAKPDKMLPRSHGEPVCV